jgi:hypothetical protein
MTTGCWSIVHITNNRSLPFALRRVPNKFLSLFSSETVHYLDGALVGDVERQHGEAARRVALLQLVELGGRVRRAARGDDAALLAPPQQLPHLSQTTQSKRVRRREP